MELAGDTTASLRKSQKDRMKGSSGRKRKSILVSEARSRRAGGAIRSELMSLGVSEPPAPPSIPFSEFSGCGGGEKEKSPDFSNRMKNREDRRRHGRRK